MKATKDKDGKISYSYEAEKAQTALRKPMEKIEPKPGKLDELKEKAKQLQAQENSSEG